MSSTRRTIPDRHYGQMIRALNAVHYATEVDFYTTAPLRPCEEALAAAVEPTVRIADVGCGAGRVTKAIAARGAGIVGVDINPVSLHAARAAVGNLGLVNATMASLPLASGAFDQVWCLRFSFNALPTRTERIDTLRELWRICAPGGLIVLEAFNWHFPGRFGLLRIANLVDAVARRLRWEGQARAGSHPLPARDLIYIANKAAGAAPGYAHLTSVAELRQLARCAGLDPYVQVTNEAGVRTDDRRPVRRRHRGYATWLVITKPESGNDHAGGRPCAS